jgi:hypothetical protein
MSNMIVLKSSIAKILIIVLFLKIMLIMELEESFIPKLFLTFQPSPDSCGTPANPLHHTSVRQHTG